MGSAAGAMAGDLPSAQPGPHQSPAVYTHLLPSNQTPNTLILAPSCSQDPGVQELGPQGWHTPAPPGVHWWGHLRGLTGASDTGATLFCL